jgi:hypothetical protein
MPNKEVKMEQPYEREAGRGLLEYVLSVALRDALLIGLTGLQQEENGAQLVAALGLQSEVEAVLADARPDELKHARQRELAGKLFDRQRVAQLIRGGLAVLTTAAGTDARSWVHVARALRQVPAWVFETPAERTARLVAENAWWASRNRRPGARARERAAEAAAQEGERAA